MPKTHTPTPWHADNGYISSNSDGYVPLNSPFIEMAHTNKHRKATVEAEANARFIARAVNNHDTLTEALRSLSQIAEIINNSQRAGLEVSPAQWSALYQATNHAKAIIEKASA